MTVWNDCTLDNPAENAPAGQSLERFVFGLARKMKPAQREVLTIPILARRLRTHFGLSKAVSRSAVKRLLAETGIELKEEDPRLCPDPTFAYDKVCGRWVIYMPLGQGLGWTRDVMHEFWEILFWRCFHIIPWWRGWAEAKRADKPIIHRPHDKGDEFAFCLLLTCGDFRRQSFHLSHNLWALMRHYHVTKNLCFRAMRQYLAFPFPVFHAIISLDTPPQQLTLDMMDDGYCRALVKHHTYKEAKEDLRLQYNPELTPDEKASWEAVKGFQARWAEDQELTIPRDDVLFSENERDKDPCWQVSCVAGILTQAPVSVITRRPSNNWNLVSLQVVPVGEEEYFLSQQEIVDDEDWAVYDRFDSIGLDLPQLV